IVLTNLHNPSGALLSAEMLQAVGKVAHRARVRLLVDEVYLETLSAKPAPYCFPIGNPIAGVSENPFIVTTSLTKVYGLSGLRCGWILAAPELARRMWLLNDLFAATGAHPAERLSLMAFDHLEQFRERARALLTANRTLLDAFLDSRRDIECFHPPAGTVVFPRLPLGKNHGAGRRMKAYDVAARIEEGDIECFHPPAGTVVFPRLPLGLTRRDPEAFFQLLREK